MCLGILSSYRIFIIIISPSLWVRSQLNCFPKSLFFAASELATHGRQRRNLVRSYWAQISDWYTCWNLVPLSETNMSSIQGVLQRLMNSVMFPFHTWGYYFLFGHFIGCKWFCFQCFVSSYSLYQNIPRCSMSGFFAHVHQLGSQDAHDQFVSGVFRDPQEWDPFMVSFPYYSHTTPIRIPKDMGIVWETHHKWVPFLGVPENTIAFGKQSVPFQMKQATYPYSGWKNPFTSTTSRTSQEGYNSTYRLVGVITPVTHL